MNEEISELRERLDELEGRVLALDVVFNLALYTLPADLRRSAADRIEAALLLAGRAGPSPYDLPPIKARIVELLARLRVQDFHI